ncbi:hypothetical protein [Streptococcus devriesei]|uniref:hypothetical protein n=1 Tax=Streptococcus devriesei TaxID=231233 RepID=UPI0003F84BD8|nr:hypothetical protein [Streptococcus devriesei]
MLKEKRNKGFVLYLVFGLCFIIGALGIFVLASQGDKRAPDVVYNGTSTNASSGDKVSLEVYDIYSKPIADIKGHKTVIWLVSYDNGYVGLESKEDDKDVAKLLNAGDSLKDKPKRITVKYYNTRAGSSKSRIRNYSGAMTGILRTTPDISKYFSFYTYVSLQDVKSDRTALPIICGILGLVGLIFIAVAFFTRHKVNQAYDELYAAYPELNGNLDLLLSGALYHDDNLKIVIYKEHLVTYFRGFRVVDLQQVVQLYHRIVKTKRYFITVNQQSFLVAVKADKKKKENMLIHNRGKKTDEELQPFFAAVQEYFPNIKIGYDKLF